MDEEDIALMIYTAKLTLLVCALGLIMGIFWNPSPKLFS